MIQDISPHKFHNEYITNVKPNAQDLIICVKDNKLLVSSIHGNLIFPQRQYFKNSFNDTYYLFSLDNQKFFLLLDELEVLPTGFQFMTLKEIRNQIKRPRMMMFAAYTAWHLALWYNDNKFCGRCGSLNRHSETERAMICTYCAHIVYPRIMPAVIVGVTNGDEILMTKYANRDIPFYALIAGFVEIGETLEECVQREVMEEVGLRVKNIRYYKSQPWGSAQDLLAGFYCDVDGDTTIKLERSELKEGVWVKREDIIGQPDDWSLTHDMMMQFKLNANFLRQRKYQRF